MLTVFTSPKPFEGRIDGLQRNAIRSWLALGPGVQVMLIGDEPGMAQAATGLGVEHHRQVGRNAYGTPLVSAIFDVARAQARFPILCYLNTDIILLDDFLPAVERVAARFDEFLVVGQRWDLDVQDRLEFEQGWPQALRRRLESSGRLHPPAGSDYFVFPRQEFTDLPQFALGRAGWDNWMIYSGRKKRLAVVDATAAITVVHQNHDYGHLPGGQPHYRLPESQENLQMAGGREMVFRLPDVNWVLGPTDLRHFPLGHATLGRRLESMIYLLLGPGRAARIARILMHPAETTRYFIHRGQEPHEA